MKQGIKYFIRDRDKDRKRRRSKSREKDREARKRERRERRERERGERVDYIKTDDGGEIRIKEEPVDGKQNIYFQSDLQPCFNWKFII